MTLPQQAKEEVVRLLRLGQRIKAVQYLAETFKVSLAEATQLADAIGREMETEINQPMEIGPPEKIHIEQLLRSGKKMEAVKYVRQQLGLGLKEALDEVEKIEREINPNATSVKGGCARSAFLLLGVFFSMTALLLFGAGGLAYYAQMDFTKESNKVVASVTELKPRNNSNQVAPVVKYSWNGKDYTYQSNFYTDPPAFNLNEPVTVYVNPENPADIVIDTFSERWLGITIFLAVGAVTTIIALVFFFISRRF